MESSLGNAHIISKCHRYWSENDFRSDYVVNRVVDSNGEFKEVDILKRPELAFYDRKGHALTGDLLVKAWNHMQIEGRMRIACDRDLFLEKAGVYLEK